ncbi:ABC transporter, ATP-binding protein [Mycoplasma haemofelis str. Langford 1]|uniref:ABC transporter, ATP binding protein n=2 Tax=Mycoplasma haemofelis TaxID=29501 RepID=F6FHP5_MYCHI|nr:ABC transporter, ATP binding protein [Mycoplasma haemofelis Ohio2]CBY93516.1 ABC transporter, ATP-binding protein [Mycoplasma haemofelis str. Langford 1]
MPTIGENLRRKGEYFIQRVDQTPHFQSLRRLISNFSLHLQRSKTRTFLSSSSNNNIRRNQFRKAPSPWGCLCSCGVYKDISRRAYGQYEDWLNNFLKGHKKRKRRSDKAAISRIMKCNSVHKGTKFMKNSEGYVIEAKNVSKWFCNKADRTFNRVLFDINLKVREGEFVIILGYSGSGKSTLLNVLSGIDRPSNGTIIVSNHNLIAMKERELTTFRKENLSFIFQHYALLPELTVKENIMQGAALQENVSKRLNLDELVDFLDIKEHLNKKPNQLSGGQQQRVAIVKSVIKNPKILFADEPTAAVDEETSKNILKIFCDINKRYKTTIVLITHNPIISKIGTKLIHIESGRIIKSHNQIPVPLEELSWVGHE